MTPEPDEAPYPALRHLLKAREAEGGAVQPFGSAEAKELQDLMRARDAIDDLLEEAKSALASVTIENIRLRRKESR